MHDPKLDQLLHKQLLAGGVDSCSEVWSHGAIYYLGREELPALLLDPDTKLTDFSPITGDLFIYLTRNLKHKSLCLVSSAVLCTFSSSFARLIKAKLQSETGMPFAKFKFKTKMILVTDDYDGRAFWNVLAVLHGRNGMVRNTVSLARMVEIAFIADKFGLREQLQLWAERWAHDCHKEFSPNISLSYDWVTVCWVFGLSYFPAVARQIVSRSSAFGSNGLRTVLEGRTPLALKCTSPSHEYWPSTHIA